MSRFLASLYSYSSVEPCEPLWERCPPRLEEEVSLTELRLAVFDSPCWARSLFTVRAAISLARYSLSPRSKALSLMCSYCRSRLGLIREHARSLLSGELRDACALHP